MALAVHTLATARSSVRGRVASEASPMGQHPQADPVFSIVLLHGFTQNSRCWKPFAGVLADLTGCEIRAVDAPGHGDSPSLHDNANLWQTADLIAEAVGSTELPTHFVGYSMGGRMALHLALAHPTKVQSLTLIGANPGIEDDAARDDRLRADTALAERLQTIGLPTFLDEWLALPLFSALTKETAHRTERLTNRAEGLATSLIACGTGAQENLWPRLHEIAVPLCVIAGANDQKFQTIAQRLTAKPVIIPDAGHSAQLEQPRATAEAVAAFVTSANS
jgi:2-succinyl-6-hydroxy-2,4-cyclohexadiene-1-carboxylate synthase